MSSKHVCITGVSSGIGLETANRLLNQGYIVHGSVRKKEDADSLKNQHGDRFFIMVFDITDEAAMKRAVQIMSDRLGEKRLTGLVNNAGIAISGPVAELDLNDLRYQFDVNFFGLIQMTQLCLPLLGFFDDQGPKGRLINMSSVSGVFTSPFMGPYCSSKFALESISDAMRREFLIRDLPVITIQPGPVKTPIWDKAKQAENKYDNGLYASIMAQKEKIIDKTIANAIAPSRIAFAVQKALESKRPKMRYMVAKDSWKIKLVSYYLPDRWVDNLFKKSIKKGRLRP